MKLLLKLSLVCALVLPAVSYAGSVKTGELVDNYIGADGNHVSNKDYTPYNTDAHYDTHWMQVEKILNDDNTGSLTVTVNSNFVSYNNSSDYRFGDLFLMDAGDNGELYQQADECEDNAGNVAYGCNQYSEQTNDQTIYGTEKSTNEWEYAFDLGGNRRNSYADDVSIDGQLKEINQDDYEYSLYSTTGNREWQAIMLNDYAHNADNNVGGGSWSTIISEDLLIMSFDITGTSLMDAAQIALRWQMTCANDIIEVVANFNKAGKTSVPEPETIVLMMLGFAGFLLQRKKLNK